MHLSHRLMLSLFVGVAAVSLASAVYQAQAEMHGLSDEIQRQAMVLAESQQRSTEQIIQTGSPRELQAHELQVLVDQYQNREHLAGVAIYDDRGQTLAITSSLASKVAVTPAAVIRSMQAGSGVGEYVRSPGKRMHIFALPLSHDGRVIGAIAVFHDAAFMAAPVWRHALTSLAQTLLIVGMTLLIVHWSLGKPLRHMAQWLRDLRTGGTSGDGRPPKEKIFGTLTSELTHLATSLNAARAAAEEEARLRDAALSLWTAERLRIAMQGKLNGSRLFAISNREPYEHVHKGSSITWAVPPSGLVTALEPVLRASDGTWIAQGTGDADRETADEHGRLPPDDPQYHLRRVWLSKEEEEGFYFGFANEGLWPLCHIAHTRPVFRSGDWEQYQSVNLKFTAVLLDEMDGEKEPVVLAQDYHFAPLPRMVKERRPDARIAIFWHIPWPNSEAFGICPWQRELPCTSTRNPGLGARIADSRVIWSKAAGRSSSLNGVFAATRYTAGARCNDVFYGSNQISEPAKIAHCDGPVGDNRNPSKEVLDGLLRGEGYGYTTDPQSRQNGRRIVAPIAEGCRHRYHQDGDLEKARRQRKNRVRKNLMLRFQGQPKTADGQFHQPDAKPGERGE